MIARISKPSKPSDPTRTDVPPPTPGAAPTPAAIPSVAPVAANAPTGKTHALPRYAVVDTTFSTVDMGRIAVDTLLSLGVPAACIVRRTVPGFKDLGVECKRLVELEGCDIAVACGFVGGAEIDKVCGHEASLGIMQARLMTNRHILEVFVHADEVQTDAELVRVTHNRVSEHAVNAYWLIEKPGELLKRAGTGQRQGFADEGAANPDSTTAKRPTAARRAVDRPASSTVRGH